MPVIRGGGGVAGRNGRSALRTVMIEDNIVRVKFRNIEFITSFHNTRLSQKVPSFRLVRR